MNTVEKKILKIAIEKLEDNDNYTDNTDEALKLLNALIEDEE